MIDRDEMKLELEVIENIKSLVRDARNRVYNNINLELLITYWNIGKEILANETKNGIDEKTARQIIIELSRILTAEIGKGFSRSNLFNMRRFYILYPSVQTLSGHLSWSHICELMIIDKQEKRSFYEIECTNSKWSLRELKRQINSSLYERLLLSKGENREKIAEMSFKGHEIAKAEDIVKSPYVFEFLGLPENKPMYEKDLEQHLVRHLESFILELGRGFMYVGSQQRITINNHHYYVDMVFYNKILKSYILIELKTRKLEISDAGQLNTYLNYYKTEVNDESDQPPIGIILCADKDEITAEYILGGYENNLFASKYTMILPDTELLMNEVEKIIKN
jgi:predicted nuclease of restriction endonuclease-like (RecB) superfamily